MKTTFSTDCLRAISHLSRSMQDRIIADVTRYQLTGEIPDKMPPMRRAVFNSLILMLNPEAPINDLKDPNDLKNTPSDADPAPNFIAIDPSGRTKPVYIPPSQLSPDRAAVLPPDHPLLRDFTKVATPQPICAP